jgi:ferredoxin--NADP+ reductase
MSRIIERRSIVPNLHLLQVEAPDIAARIKPGQFIIVMVDEKGERVPLTIADWDESSVTVVFMEVGTSTHKLAKLKSGDDLSVVVGPLGRASRIESFGNVVCAGGCYGIASIYPVVRELKEKGNSVTTVVEARSNYLVYWEKKLRSVSDKLIVATKDGSYGEKGDAASVLRRLLTGKEPINHVFAMGCTFMMMGCSNATRESGVPTMVSLNSIMVDGTGMCGACRVEVGGETKFACVDGPEFDGHQVNFDLLMKRRGIYLPEENQSVQGQGT